MGKKQSLQQIVLGKLDSSMQKNETGPLSHTIHESKSKMDERPKCEAGNHQNPRGEHRQQHLRPQSQQLLTRHIREGTQGKQKQK